MEFIGSGMKSLHEMMGGENKRGVKRAHEGDVSDEKVVEDESGKPPSKMQKVDVVH